MVPKLDRESSRYDVRHTRDGGAKAASIGIAQADKVKAERPRRAERCGTNWIHSVCECEPSCERYAYGGAIPSEDRTTFDRGACFIRYL